MPTDWPDDYDYRSVADRISRSGWSTAVVGGILSVIGIGIGIKLLLDEGPNGGSPHLALGWALILGFVILLCLDGLAWRAVSGIAKNLDGMQVLVERSNEEAERARAERKAAAKARTP